MQTSGFLGSEYALLREGEEGEALQVYRNPNADWAAYYKIKLDPVTKLRANATTACSTRVRPPN